MSTKTRKAGKTDKLILFLVVALVLIGLVMVYSSSYIRAYYDHKAMDSFFRSNALYAGIGIALMCLISYIPYRLYRINIVMILLCGGVLLLLTFVLFNGATINNSARWIKLFGRTIQPSEFAKPVAILYVAKMISSRKASNESFLSKFSSLLLVFALPVVFIVLIAMQPHFSTAITILSVISYMVLVSGEFGFLYLGTFFSIIGGMLLLFLLSKNYALERIKNLIGSENSDGKAAQQITNALGAISGGGLLGRGLGKSVQKYLYLSAAYNDMIFAIFAEELGFFRSLILFLCFFILIVSCLRVANLAPDRFSSFLVIGITAQIAFQFIVNIGVTLNILPITGVPLPFISFGGTSLLTNLASMGIVLNVSRYAKGTRKPATEKKAEGERA